MSRRLAWSAPRGHTLLELIIALALGMLVIVGSLTLYRGQRAAFERAADLARIHDAGVAALDLVGQQVQMAGFASSGNIASNLPALFGCVQGRTIGTDDAPACETLASHSDGLLVRYAADAVATWPSASGTPTDCLGQSTGAQIVNRYYAKASSSTGEPELYCEGAAKQAQPLVEGVERLRAAYWMPGAVAAVDAAGVGRDGWRAVNAVDLCVLVRGEPTGAARPAVYTDCDGSRVTATDTRTHRAFWRRVAVRNAAAPGSLNGSSS